MLVVLIVAGLVESPAGVYLVPATVLGSTALLFVYSYFVWRSDPDSGPSKGRWDRR